jgi:hypothetical protein
VKCALVTCGLLMLTVLAVNGDSRLSLVVSPAISFAPATLRVQVKLDRNADNRRLTVVAESEDYYRSSEVQLDGDRAPARIVIDFRSVPSGDYQVIGVLMDGRGHQLAATFERIRVMPSLGG